MNFDDFLCIYVLQYNIPFLIIVGLTLKNPKIFVVDYFGIFLYSIIFICIFVEIKNIWELIFTLTRKN